MASADSSATDESAPRPNRGLAPLAGLLVLAARAPFLFEGCGVDPDAWRVYLSARNLWLNGVYHPSRFPGYPVQEIACAPLSALGPWALNLATALMSALAAVALLKLFEARGSREGPAAAFALAFVPALAISSASAMDYPWGLACFLWAWVALLRGYPLWAGVLLGLAVGCRITWALGAVPLALECARLAPAGTRGRGRVLARFAVTALAAGLAGLAPLWTRWGLGFLHGYPFTYPDARTIALRAGEDLWGRVGLIAWVGTLTAWLWRRMRRGTMPEAERALATDARAACWTGLGLFVALFLCVPMDAGYLIPAIPFVLLLAASCCERRMFRVLCVLLATASLLSLGRAGPKAGPLVEDLGLRRLTNAAFARALAAAQRLDRPALIVCGVHQPGFLGRLPDADFARTFDAEAMEAKRPLPFGPARLVYTITRQEAQDARAQGQALYYLADQDAYNFAVTGFDPKEFGAQPLAP